MNPSGVGEGVFGKDGLRVVGLYVYPGTVGLFVVGTAVTGAKVLGLSVVGATVVGLSVLGADVTEEKLVST